VVDEDGVLNTETTEKTFQHGSDRVNENVENEKLVYGENCVLHVEIICDLIQEESHKDLKTDALKDRYQNLEKEY
jgi:hypothetical protein